MNEEQGFIEWSQKTPNQQGKIFSNDNILKMVEQLKIIIPNKLNKVDNTKRHDSLFKINDVNKMKKLKNRFSKKTNGDLYDWDWNEQGHGFGSSAIHRYMKYLESKGKIIHLKEKKTSTKNNIKNIILYGPPGVGKTHNYQRLISMIESGDDEKTIFDIITNNKSSEVLELNQEAYKEIENQKRVEFITFHQSYSYEDFIEGFRPTEDGNIKLEDGIFKTLAKKALNNQKAAQQKHITFDEAYDILRTRFIENELEQLQTVRGINIIINEFADRFLKVISEGAKNEQYIKKGDLESVTEAILQNKVQKPVDIKNLNVKKDTISLAGYYFPIGKMIASIMSQNNSHVEEQNYYIIIDEINRGNISKIFGELITLIEEDKRDKYAVTLPYSKERFVIPSNLYVIATMNSTDKSIATIDIALRRRFTFLKMEPNSHLVLNEEAKRLMLYLNEYIEKTLGKDFLLGHSYFMGENLDLKFVKEYKIRPLLEEYFYSDDNLDIDKLMQGDTNAS